ncbi:MAG: aminomethyl-transferring glycine dehydrogenase subunit GcvPA [Alphaproteobacteria bacterium]|nr:aminomethyl-transferring glycine dehydrogenase subunit GcvPA [Alphaproteobacteria bacterium]
MKRSEGLIHPYVPNAAPEPRRRLMAAIGIRDAMELYDSIPGKLRLKGPLDLPEPIRSEQALRRHVEGILARNRSCQDLLNFRGAGCWQHFVPSVCDEINGRGEFLTAYGGWPYSDHGKYQALFEFQSMLGELVGLDVVGTPTYDWGAAANSAVLMACRLVGRRAILVPECMSPDRLSQMRGFTKPAAAIGLMRQDARTGLIDLKDLRARISADVGAVYIESPGYLGTIETQGPEIAKVAHDAGAMLVVGVDPSALGVLAGPGEWGADLVVGDLQPLGIHMYGGGGGAGFIASRDKARIVAQHPSFLVSITPARAKGQYGFGVSTMDRTSYEKREKAEDYYGTTQWLWGITAAVYLALLGPKGMQELGLGIMQRAQYAAKKLNAIKGVKAPALSGPFFKEFVVNFDRTGKTVAAVNRALRRKGILGGKDLSREFPRLGQSALYCVTEIHTKGDIDTLAQATKEVLS